MKVTVYRKHADPSDLGTAGASLWTVRNRKCELPEPRSGAKFLLTRRCNLFPYTVTFDATGGIPEFPTKDGYVAQKIGDLPSASYSDKYFNGWYDSNNVQVTKDDVMSIRTKTCYARWIDPTIVNFNANGGTITTQSIKLYVGVEISGLPSDPVGPSDKPNFVGWYTSADGGTRVKNGDTYSGSYTTLYAHYAAQSYTVDLNGQWFLDDRSGTDPNGKSYGTSYSTNPDPSQYDGTYISYSNFNVGNGWAKMRINFIGYSEFTVYIRSYAESNYDYTVIGNVDQNITSNPSSGYERTYGSQTSGTAISNYKKVTYSNLDGGQHFVDVVFRKDGSVNSNQDRGYVLIPNNAPPQQITITFNTNGGSYIEPITMMSGNKITRPQDPTKTDQYFAGWYSDSELTQSWNFDTVIHEDMTLHAKWRDTELPYKTALNYIQATYPAESDTSEWQWIETDIPYSQDIECEMSVSRQTVDGDTSGQVVGVVGKTWMTYHFTFWQDGFSPSPGSSYDRTGLGFTDKDYHILYNTDENKVIIDGTSQSNWTTSTGSGSQHIMIGWRQGQNALKFMGKIYWMKFRNKSTDTMLLDLIPVLDNNGRPCLYDKIAGKFFYNKGSGSDYLYG